MLEKLLGAVSPLKKVNHVSQPLEGALLCARRSLDVLAVAPMSGDAAFGDIVHFIGPDLDFDALFFGPDNCRVNRPVTVWLGRRDKVLETLRDHLPVQVKDAEG